jgi:parallel beta-helix repeat protein
MLNKNIERLEDRVMMDGGGIHSTGFDKIPLYVDSANPDTQTVHSGNWNDASVWSNGVPTEISDALINEGHNIKISNSTASVDDLQVNGELFFSIYGDAQLDVKTLTVFGGLELGTEEAPIQGTAGVVFQDAPIDTAFDPQMFGHGLIVIDGDLTVNGGTFRSENPAGDRAHIMVTGHSNIDVNDAVFDDLGRTTNARLDNTHLGPNRELLHLGANQIGRYTFHAHHVYGNVEITDSVFEDGRRWGLALHDTDNALISDNTITRFDGAGIAIEDGSEIGNTISDNIISYIRGSGQGTQGRTLRDADPLKLISSRKIIDPTLYGDGTLANPYRTVSDLGHEGAGIWSRSATNNFVHNVISNVTEGIVLWPRFNLNGNGMRQLGHVFDANEVYSSRKGFGIHGVSDFLATDSIINNCYKGVDLQYGGTVTFNGGSVNVSTNEGFFTNGVAHLILENMTIKSLKTAVHFEEAGTIRNSFIQGTPDIIWQTVLPTLENVTFGDGVNNMIFKAR